MKTSIIIAMLFAFININQAQTIANQSSVTLENLTASIQETPVKNSIKTTTDISNSAAIQQLSNHLAENIEYPDRMLENQIEGTVWVNVSISKTGTIVATQIVKSISTLFDKEVLKAIDSFPQIDGQLADEQAVRKVKLPVYFSLK